LDGGAERRRGNTLIVADGFSCREQIAQATGRLATANVANGARHPAALTAALLGAGVLALSATLLRRARHTAEAGAGFGRSRRTR
jgi:hypothetical protein